MSWHDDTKEPERLKCRGNWLDELITDASKTIAVGVGAEDHKVCGLNMKRGRCPVCGEAIERVKGDIYFPYCGYEHKRRVQRVQEAAERAEFERMDEMARERRERELAIKRENNRRRREERELIAMEPENRRAALKARLQEAQAKWSEHAGKASKAPKSSRERYRSEAKARKWYERIIETQRQLKELEAHENVEESALQGLEQNGTAQDAGAGHEQSGDRGFVKRELRDDIPAAWPCTDEKNLHPRV